MGAARRSLERQLLSSGRNVFEELGAGFTLFAFDTTDGIIADFERAAKRMRVPLKIVRDSYGDGRLAYEAKFILVRPDRYIAWTAESAPADVDAIVRKVIAG